jgi:hypothetical protein
MASSFASRAKCVSGCHRQRRNKPMLCSVKVNSSDAVFASNLWGRPYRAPYESLYPAQPILQT